MAPRRRRPTPPGPTAPDELRNELVVLSAVGPHPVRAAAGATAQRLVASGLPDPRWADGPGHPTVGASFGYVDMFGAQEAVAITFSHRRKQHVIADRPRTVRDDYPLSARRCGIDLDDHSTADAADILGRPGGTAMSASPRPGTRECRERHGGDPAVGWLDDEVDLAAIPVAVAIEVRRSGGNGALPEKSGKYELSRTSGSSRGGGGGARKRLGHPRCHR